MASGRNRDNSGAAQQIAVPRPAHLRDETDNVATIIQTDSKRQWAKTVNCLIGGSR